MLEVARAIATAAAAPQPLLMGRDLLDLGLTPGPGMGMILREAYKAQLEASDDPEALLAEIQQRLDSVHSPFRTAEAFLVEEIIDPRDTRPLLCEFANLIAPLRTPGRSAFHLRP